MNKKLVPILSGVVTLLLILMMIPGLLPTSSHSVLGGLALLAALAATVLLFLGGKDDAPQAVAEPARPVATSTEAQGSADAEVIAFLGLMQEKGRLIDFLMDDISQHDDATVGAVARVVYQGCRGVLDEHLKVSPLAAEAEGASITVPEGYKATDYRLSGKLSGEAPFSGKLVHKGWQVDSIKLPKVVGDGEDLPALAPAQVEV